MHGTALHGLYEINIGCDDLWFKDDRPLVSDVIALVSCVALSPKTYVSGGWFDFPLTFGGIPGLNLARWFWEEWIRTISRGSSTGPPSLARATGR